MWNSNYWHVGYWHLDYWAEDETAILGGVFAPLGTIFLRLFDDEH